MSIQRLTNTPTPVPKPKSIKELLTVGGPRIAALTARSAARTNLLVQVRAALPPELATHVTSAEILATRLTLGVDGAAWASRLRYATDPLRLALAGSTGIALASVRIKVVPPRA